MPKISQSFVDTSSLGPRISTPNRGTITPPAAPIATAPWQSPFMTSPMPLAASGSDSLSRQFYGATVVPQLRILPVRSRR